MITKRQSDNTAWFQFRKGTVTASKSHEIKAKMEKFVKVGIGYVNMWNLCQKISGLTSINPNIPTLKYGRDMEQHSFNVFFELFKSSHKKPRLSNCELFLDGEQPFIGATPDGIAECACHGGACLEIKCPFSISHKSPTDPGVKLPFLKIINNEQKLNQNHKYYTQCQQQMAITGTEKCCFYVFTSHGFYLEEILFDEILFQFSRKGRGDLPPLPL